MTTPTTRSPDGPIDRRIEKVYAELPPKSQRVADAVLDHLGDIASYSVSELAELSGTSQATVSRLFASLGFEDFAAVKAHVRGLRTAGVPISGTDTAGAAVLSEHVARETRNLQRLLETIHEETLQQAAKTLADADTVLTIGYRNSYPVALHLRTALLQCRPRVGVHPQPGQSLGEELAQLTERDAVVVVGFRRRLSSFGELMRVLAASPATVILLADSSARRYATLADLWLECPLESVGAFDSYAAAMSVVSVLADAVLDAGGSAGTRRVSAISSVYEELGELDA
ncbi:MurR/RpiR family transcriptional regulator [Leifsonia virtsii]|uniref:MurR/RpiR family transcriptional regulator n=1 Tax=Leifsonia virtsii TaxID=3035915 RepID=A0ABT8IWJ5_9MICO|nr:MurR/RpiR family transcriptional regulator [Leifsonia virtsii]MDN4597203.1 MurR/RpiR family transcriptional regulator [Leifsonia virtsii]